MSRFRRSSFVVRVVEKRRGPVGGVIERVATGAKEAFTDLDAIGRVIRAMLRYGRSHAVEVRRSSLPPPEATLVINDSSAAHFETGRVTR